MRVSFNQSFATSVRHMQRRGSEYEKATETASTGKRIGRPSDDPGGYAEVLSRRSRLSTLASYSENLRYTINEASYADSALQSVQNALQRVVELANGGVSETMTAEGRLGNALEIRSLREEIRLTANTRFHERLVFGGGLSAGEVFDASGTYLGGSTPPEVLAGDGYRLTTGLPGDEVFGTAAGGVDIFRLLDDLATAFEADDPQAAHTMLASLDQSIDQISTARAFYGSVTNQADALLEFYDAATVQETEGLSRVEDVDAIEAYSDLQRLSVAYQASLQASAQIGKRTLFDYL